MRQKIVNEARSWLGVRFAHQGRSKETGCDCIGLIVGVAQALNLRSRSGRLLVDCDYQNYSMTPNDNQLQCELAKHLYEIDEYGPGDIVLLRFAKNPQHLAIVSEANYGGKWHPTLIHAYSVAAIVCEHRFDHRWQRRLVGVYTIIPLDE